MAKVITGFSKPYVALYSASGTTVSYKSGQILARGVDVSASVETSDESIFYADNQAAETAAGTFTSGTVSLTVDGLTSDAAKLIYGLPDAGDDGFTAYGDDMTIPYVGIGFITRQQALGVVTWTPFVFPKVCFELNEDTAATQEDSIDFQTQSLKATIFRADNANATWKYVGSEYSTEAEAEAALKTKLGIS